MSPESTSPTPTPTYAYAHTHKHVYTQMCNDILCGMVLLCRVCYNIILYNMTLNYLYCFWTFFSLCSVRACTIASS